MRGSSARMTKSRQLPSVGIQLCCLDLLGLALLERGMSQRDLETAYDALAPGRRRDPRGRRGWSFIERTRNLVGRRMCDASENNYRPGAAWGSHPRISCCC